MAKNLITNIIVNGQVSSSFKQMANQIMQLGQLIEPFSRPVLEFEKKSVEIYQNYEDNMLAAQFALSAQYKSASKLAQVMDGLDNAAQQWAATTIFHTSDVSAAINEAAHAGWSFEQILSGIPKAMLIAQAGGLELSDGLDYLIKMMYATGTSFDDMDTLIDQWAKAANLSATDINELGQAFLSLGASATFGDSTQELFTMLAVLANAGTTGSKAGTLLRTAMMRVVAPTTKAEAAMEILGADIEEINEVLADENVTKAAKKLQGLGFSAYDAQGNLKPMLTIFTEMWGLIKDLDEEAQNEILAGIFPLRSINAAKAFMAAVGNGSMAELFKDIGDSEGYAASGAEIMMSGLTGAIETLSSKWEEFQRTTGETLAPAIENVAGALGSVVDWLNDLDEPTMSALVGGLTTLAGLGPTLLMAGFAMRMISAHPVATGLLLASIGLGAIVGYVSKLNELNFESVFGNVTLNVTALGEQIDAIETKFTNDKKTLSQWEEAVTTAAQTYKDKNTELSELMLTDVLTGKKLDKTEKDNLIAYANDIGNALYDGIKQSKAKQMTITQMLFGDEKAEEGLYLTDTEVVNAYYEGLFGEANALGQQLRDQLTAALRDDQLDAAELEAIQKTRDRMNRIAAQIQSMTRAEELNKQLLKSQRVSYDSVHDFVTANNEKLNSEIDAINEQYDDILATRMTAYEWAIENGMEFVTINGVKRKVSWADYDAMKAGVEKERQEAIASTTNKYGTVNRTAVDTAFKQSGMAEAWALLNGLPLDENGNLDFTDAFAGKTPAELTELTRQFDWLADNRAKILRDFNLSGEEGLWLERMLTGAMFAGQSANTWRDYMNTYGFDTLPEMSKLEEAEMELYKRDRKRDKEFDLNTRIARLLARKDEYQAAYDRYYNNEGRPWFYQGNADKANVQLWEKQMPGWDAEIARLQEELDNLDKPLTVETEVDDTAVKNYNPGEKTLYIIPTVRPGSGGDSVDNYVMTKYAEGGRASMASIFGDAGPEWAIPEEHSERTASLLNAAREASGFTWGDLIGRYGGLNAGNGGVTVNYQPVINGGDGAGIAAALAQDRDALVKLVKNALEEAKYKNAVFAY